MSVKHLIAVLALMLLAACEVNYVEKACDKTQSESVRMAAREGAAAEGLYMKCVKEGRSWGDYTLTLDGEPVP